MTFAHFKSLFLWLWRAQGYVSCSAISQVVATAKANYLYYYLRPKTGGGPANKSTWIKAGVLGCCNSTLCRLTSYVHVQVLVFIDPFSERLHPWVSSSVAFFLSYRVSLFGFNSTFPPVSSLGVITELSVHAVAPPPPLSAQVCASNHSLCGCICYPLHAYYPHMMRAHVTKDTMKSFWKHDPWCFRAKAGKCMLRKSFCRCHNRPNF